VSGASGSKRWIVPAAALACGLSIGLVAAWHATRPATVTSPPSAASEAAPARQLEVAPPVIAPLASSALVSPSSTIPTVEPAPSGVAVKAPAPSAPHASTAAPIATPKAAQVPAPKPSAKPAPVKKSPAELMMDRN